MNGDLSNDKANPSNHSPLALAPGANSVIGSVVSPADRQDWFYVTIADGFQLDSITLASFPSADTGFTGFQRGTQFIGNEEGPEATEYMGYVHLTSSLQGTDILDNMSVAFGAQQFTTPLPAGDYTFLVQQANGTPSSYQFDFNVTAVPEPRAQAAVAGILGLAFLVHRRFAKAKCA